MELKIGLESVAAELPELVVKAQDWAYLDPVIPGPLKGSFKFPTEIRRCRNDDAAEILAEGAARKALDKAGLKPSDIDFIIANQSGGKYVIPMVGTYVHRQLGFSEETPVLNILQACASFVDGCEIARNLIQAGKYKRILVVVVSAWETIGSNGRGDLTDVMSSVMGDGAGAGIVSTENLKCEFLAHYNRTFSETYFLSGKILSKPANPGLEGAPAQPAESMYMFGSPKFFTWWLEIGERFGIDGFKGVLKNTNFTLSDIDAIVFHQPADMLYDMWMDGAEKEGVPMNKWKHTWHEFGNLAPAVVPVNLALFQERGELKKDWLIALITIGSGGHCPTMLIRWLD